MGWNAIADLELHKMFFWYRIFLAMQIPLAASFGLDFGNRFPI